ncbi:MAG: hypothetical protein M3Q56_01175 [Bacteroidota bacterium]|nr:hypothetical protein [Bacteroidota bacterium]
MSKISFEKYLQLEDDLRRFRKALKEAQEIMLNEDVSLYPIFIFHQQELEMGIPLIEAGPETGIWSVHASSLEEFMVKNVIHQDKIEDFRKLYKDHDHHFCIFVLSELGAQFIFYPIKEEVYREYGNLN